jgi:hypothetical protein
MSPDDLWACLWGAGGQFHELRIAGATCWIPCPDRAALTRLLHADDAYVSLVPRTAKDAFALAPAWVLWARLEAPACALHLQRLRTGPTLVAREGASSRRLALWALSEPLTGTWITRANERLAYALKGRRGTADASALLPSPFTRLTTGRRSPNPLVLEYASDRICTARQIVGGLPDAPAADGWRAAA